MALDDDNNVTLPSSVVTEKKRQAALHKEAAWDGSLANTSLDT